MCQNRALMRLLRRPLSTWIVLGAALFVVFASLAVGWSAPPLNSGDEAAHLDYAISVWHGHLPVFEDGLTIAPPFGIVPPVQWVSQHPPLYYAILAPVVGPLWDSGHPYVAVLGGRSMSALLAGAAVVATGWGVRRILPTRPAVAPVAAVLVSLTGMFQLVGGAVYSDLPVVALGVLALGAGAVALREGLRTGVVVTGAVVGALGMLSRLSFAVFLVALVVAFALAPWRRSGFWGGWRGHLVAVGGAVVVPGLAAGWFFLRNIAITGNVAGSHPEWSAEHLGRRQHTLLEVATGDGFWRGMFGMWQGHIPATVQWHWALLVLPLLIALVVAVVVAVRALLRRRRGAEPAARLEAGIPGPEADGRAADWLVAAMVVAVFALVVVGQIDFSAGGGAANTRYGLPLLPVLALVMAYGLTGLGRVTSAVLTTLWIAGAAVIWFEPLNLSTPAFTSVHALTVSRVAVCTSRRKGAATWRSSSCTGASRPRSHSLRPIS